jgi:hypothetical protein
MLKADFPFLLSKAQPKNGIVTPQIWKQLSATRVTAQFTFFHTIFPHPRPPTRQVSKFYHFQASLNHRANACSCYDIKTLENDPVLQRTVKMLF